LTDSRVVDALDSLAADADPTVRGDMAWFADKRAELFAAIKSQGWTRFLAPLRKLWPQ
jgi:hypothetical protein